jgi:protein O-GlcNAc transferase
MSPAQFQTLLQSALAHHQAGRLSEAERLYRQALAAQPNHFDPVHLLGVVAYQQGRYREAIELYSRALRISPKSAICEMRLGLAYAAAGEHLKAETRLRNALSIDPRQIDGWMGLGITLRVLGKIDEAIGCYEKVVQLEPKHAEAHDQIGALTADTKGTPAGIPHFKKAVEANSKYAPGWCNLGLALLSIENFGEAALCFARALEIDPKLNQARIGRALSLQQSYDLYGAAAEFAAALREDPSNHQARSGRLLTLNYLPEVSREQLFAEHLEFGKAAHEQDTAPSGTRFPVMIEPDRRLRVGFLSPDFRAHSIAYFIEPILRHLDRAQFEIFLYHDHFKSDAITERLKGLAAHWKNFVGQLDPVVETSLRADALDILVDLAGHTGINRLNLFAKRLAPVQVTYLGYPNTTGLRAMDYRFVDAVTDPDDQDQQFHTEKLVRFSECAWTFQPPAGAPEPSRSHRDTVTFGSFNNLAKLSTPTLRTWAELLKRVPNSRLLLKGQGVGDAVVRTNMERKLLAAGFDLARVELLTRTPNIASHLELYRDVDVALDPFPYHGTTTTCEALWMGVPVVSLTGDRHAARVGASLLRALGRSDWCAHSTDAYLEIASSLVQDPAQLDELRAVLRPQMEKSALFDHVGQAKRFGDALRDCWCRRGSK